MMWRKTKKTSYSLIIVLIVSSFSLQARCSEPAGSKDPKLTLENVKACLAIAAAVIALPVGYYQLCALKAQSAELKDEVKRIKKKYSVEDLSLRIEVEKKCRELARVQIQRRLERGDYEHLSKEQLAREESKLIRRYLRRELAKIEVFYESDSDGE